MPTTSRPAPVARLRTPAEAVAVVPHLCGFVPSSSLVLVSVRGPRRRVGLTMRADLPEPSDADRLAAELVDRAVRDRAHGVLATVWSDQDDAAGALPHAELVDALTARCHAAHIELVGALLVRRGRWWSYDCADDACCPSAGTPVDAGGDAVEVVAASGALAGRAVLPSRAALAASLAPPSGAAAHAAAARLASAGRARARRAAAEGRAAVGSDGLRLWRCALERGPDAEPGPELAAALTVHLGDIVVRDTVLSWALGDDAALLALLLALAARTPPPHDTMVCAVLAWVAHARGDGALANVALDRALAADSPCSLAQLCRQALDAQVPPGQLRRLVAASRRALHAAHPWAGTVPPPSGS